MLAEVLACDTVDALIETFEVISCKLKKNCFEGVSALELMKELVMSQ